MKLSALCISLLVAASCNACELVSVETVRNDVEAAFRERSFAALTTKYAGATPVQLILENDSDDDPASLQQFANIAEFAKWFAEKHEFSAAMFIPHEVECDARKCTYSVPELTMHHAVYLQGFERAQRTGCTALTKVLIFWG